MGPAISRTLLLTTLLLVTASIHAQSFSDRQQIAIFRLSYYGQPPHDPPPNVRVEIRTRRGSVTVELRGTGNPSYDDLFARAFGAVDETIRSVFINLGRFDVIGMEQRLSAASVDDFISALSDYTASKATVPEAVLLGQEAFTEADFHKLAGGFVVVIPSVSWYDLGRTDKGSFVAQMETSFTFIDVRDMQAFEQFTIDTSGTDDDPANAVRAAVSALPTELSYRIRSMSEFQLRTGILEVDGDRVTIEFGRNMGVVPGDEYAIVAERVLSTGHIATTDTGLIVISEVQGEFSYGRVLYANPSAHPGDQLREVPRRGFDTTPYFNVLTNGITMATVLGVRGVASRGFFDLRPLAAFEIPLRGTLVYGYMPVNLTVGGEWNLYLGRIRLSPSLEAGVGGLVPLSSDAADAFYLSHLGASAKLTASLLVSRDVLVSVQTGLGYWLGLVQSPSSTLDNVFSSYGGLVIGGSVTFK